MGLTCRVLPLSGGQNLAQNGLRDLGFVDACALYHGFQHSTAQIMGGRIGECAAKTADGGTRGGCNYNIGHLFLVLCHQIPCEDQGARGF